MDAIVDGILCPNYHGSVYHFIEEFPKNDKILSFFFVPEKHDARFGTEIPSQL